MAATAVIAGVTVGTAYMQSEAQKEQGKYQRHMAELNSRNARLQEADAVKRGDIEAANYKKKIEQTVGSQRAASAAQGVDVNVGDAMTIQEQTREIGALDALTIKNNAYREALGYRSQALQFQFEGANAANASETAARNTLLAGGLSALSYGADRSGGGGKRRSSRRSDYGSAGGS